MKSGERGGFGAAKKISLTSESFSPGNNQRNKPSRIQTRSTELLLFQFRAIFSAGWLCPPGGLSVMAETLHF
jgi:hypothetical protein